MRRAAVRPRPGEGVPPDRERIQRLTSAARAFPATSSAAAACSRSATWTEHRGGGGALGGAGRTSAHRPGLTKQIDAEDGPRARRRGMRMARFSRDDRQQRASSGCLRAAAAGRRARPAWARSSLERHLDLAVSVHRSVAHQKMSERLRLFEILHELIDVIDGTSDGGHRNQIRPIVLDPRPNGGDTHVRWQRLSN